MKKRKISDIGAMLDVNGEKLIVEASVSDKYLSKDKKKSTS